MGETSQFSPESASSPFAFKIGDESFGVEGGLTEGKFTGMIRGADGKEFAGLVEDLGDGRYRIEDWESGMMIEPSSEQPLPPVEAAPVGLEDTAVVAMEAAPVEKAAAELQPAPAELVTEAATELPTEAVEPTPVLEPQPILAPAPMPEPTLQPETAAAPVEAGQPLTIARARQQFDQEFKDLDARARQARYDAGRKTSLQKQSQELRAEAEKARNSVNKLRNKDRIAEAISEEGRLVREAKKLEGQAAIINSLEDADTQAIEDRRQRARDLTQEVERWGNLMENPILIEEYRGLDGRMQTDLAEVDRLFGGGNPDDQVVLDAARKRIEARTQARRTELQGMFPRRFMELAGMAPRHDLPDASIDYTLDRDLIERYYQFADRFYAELTGQPQAVQPEMPPEPEPEPMAPPEEVVQPVIEPTAEAVAEPEAAEQATEIPPPPAAGEQVAPAPVEAPAEAAAEVTPVAEIVVDEEERARAAAARPAGAAPAEPVEAPMPAAPMEAPARPETAGETPEQKFERRKQGFAGALAELDRARGDTSGTEGEQRVRLAEAYNQAIGAAMELMEEGETAKEVVKGFFAGAVGTPGGRKLTEVAVRSRMDEAGVTGAPAGEKKKKLEQVGLWGLLELLLELGMSFTDKTIGAVVSEVQSATGGGK